MPSGAALPSVSQNLAATPVEREDTRAGARVQGSFLATAICGYVVFLAIVLVFHVWLAWESDALVSAVWGGLFLSVTALGASAFTTLVVPLLRGQKVGRRRQARPPARGRIGADSVGGIACR